MFPGLQLCQYFLALTYTFKEGKLRFLSAQAAGQPGSLDCEEAPTRVVRLRGEPLPAVGDGVREVHVCPRHLGRLRELDHRAGGAPRIVEIRPLKARS